VVDTLLERSELDIRGLLLANGKDAITIVLIVERMVARREEKESSVVTRQLEAC
jgi:hypothetical protein